MPGMLHHPQKIDDCKNEDPYKIKEMPEQTKQYKLPRQFTRQTPLDKNAYQNDKPYKTYDDMCSMRAYERKEAR
jgi:hypothetical protein